MVPGSSPLRSPPPQEPGLLQEGAWDASLAGGNIPGFVFPLLPSIGGRQHVPCGAAAPAGESGGSPCSSGHRTATARTPPRPQPAERAPRRAGTGPPLLLIPGVIPESGIRAGGR